jgi:hypothetical protein
MRSEADGSPPRPRVIRASTRASRVPAANHSLETVAAGMSATCPASPPPLLPSISLTVNDDAITRIANDVRVITPLMHRRSFRRSQEGCITARRSAAYTCGKLSCPLIFVGFVRQSKACFLGRGRQLVTGHTLTLPLNQYRVHRCFEKHDLAHNSAAGA